jgi:hypothetical protein
MFQDPSKGTQKTTTHNIKYLLDDSFVAITQQNCQQQKIKFVIHTITYLLFKFNFCKWQHLRILDTNAEAATSTNCRSIITYG